MNIRKQYIDQINNAYNFLPIVVLIGARQVGKTTIMDNIKLYGKTLKLNGQNSEEAGLFEKYSIIENYLKVNLNAQIDGYLLIDELQYIHGISTIIKLLTDKNPKLKILATGSSSLDILQKVEESLAGRVRIINVYPLSFEEYIMFYDKTLFSEYQNYEKNIHDEVINKEIKILLYEYLIYGGMPRIALARKQKDKIDLLNDIYQTYLLKDVKAYVKNEDAFGFNKLLRLLAAHIANLVNISELSKSSGLSYKRTEEYLYLLEQMFIIKQLEPYFINKKSSITKMKKTFFYDTGMRNLIYNSFNDIEIRIDNGAIFENFVFLEIMNNLRPYKINFYRTKDGTEIDFIMSDYKKLYSFEVKFKKTDKAINTRSLKNFNKEQKISNSYLINLNFNKEIEGIRYYPAYLISKLK